MKENDHHVFFRRDKKRLPRDFDLNDKRNKVKLPVDTHNELHYIIDTTPCFENNLSLRVYLANMAYNNELDRIPENIYLKDPREMMRK